MDLGLQGDVKFSFEPGGSENGEDGLRNRAGRACPMAFGSPARSLWLPWAAVRPEARLSTRSVLGAAFSASRRHRWVVEVETSAPPAPFDRAVFRACEWMAHDTYRREGRMPAEVTFRMSDVCERLCVAQHPRLFRPVADALQRLSAVRIRRAGGEAGRLVERVHVPTNRIPREGVGSVTFALVFGRSYLQWAADEPSIPVHWELWSTLKDPLTQRCLEILAVEFALRALNTDPFPASELFALLPLPYPGTEAGVRQVLDAAHQELLRARFIDAASLTGKGKDLSVRYVPGPAARAALFRAGAWGSKAPAGLPDLARGVLAWDAEPAVPPRGVHSRTG
jgi:hypothetical protein